MEISNDVLTWTSEDVSVFRTFLQTETGKKLLPKLLENVPPLFRGGPTNEILIRSGEVHAWGEAARSILALSVPQADPPDKAVNRPSYPDPMDDEQWSDGLKVK